MAVLLKQLLNENRWKVSGIMVLLFVVGINVFPSGYIINGGDVIQFLDLKEHYLGKVFFDNWMLGRNSLFYGIFYVLDFLGISNTGQLSWYLALFLFTSFFSFFIFCKSVFPKISDPVRVLMALFYATNLYTLFIFTSTWGFTPYQILYVFIPALTGLYFVALRKTDKKSIFWFLLVAFFASMSFSNPAFAVSLTLYFSLLTAFLFLFHLVVWERKVWLRILAIVIGTGLLHLYWILPLIPKAGAGLEDLSTSEVIVLPETLRKTSNAIFDSIRFMPTHEQDVYYPINFPYPAFFWMKPVISFLAFIPFFLIVGGLFRIRTSRERKFALLFFSLFVVFIMLVARARFPFTIFNDFLFQLPGMNALRGYDKLAIFVPFIMSVSLLLFFGSIRNTIYKKIGLVMFAGLIVVLALPFYFGGIQTRMSHMLAREKVKDYREASYSALVKVPEPYRDIQKIFDQDKEDNKITMLPYSPGSSIGKVSFPVWQVNGPSVARVIYDKQFIELSEPYIPNWNFAKDFEKSYEDPRWITDLYGLLGVKYVMFHKDAKKDAVNETEKAREYLEKSGVLILITENNSFRLYEIKKESVFPYVYESRSSLSLVGKSVGLSEKVSEFQKNTKTLSYQWKNQKFIVIDIKNLNTGPNIVLNEKYDPLWRARYYLPSGEKKMLERDAKVKYANAWKINEEIRLGSVEVYYMPLRLLFAGMWISGFSLIMVVIGLVYFSRKKRNL